MIKDEQEGNNILKHFITVDEVWLYYYDPTIKQQSSEWKHPSSPTLKKANTVKSAGKVMTIIFFITKELCINTLSNPVLSLEQVARLWVGDRARGFEVIVHCLASGLRRQHVCCRNRQDIVPL
ncbi:hypothetical protein TNCV_71531 [Trichonephila clavipes]|nr:hypothetical protein TNCV_71531 [Trichonephila clavipes]